MKIRSAILCLVFISFILPFGNAKATNMEIIINTQPLAMEQTPQMNSGTTFVPMRAIFEKLEAKVSWEQETRKVVAEKGETKIELTIGKPHAVVNGNKFPLAWPAYISNNTTYVPLRFISETLNSKVLWNNRSKTITIITEQLDLLTFDEEKVLTVFGKPKLRLLSQYGFEWLVYHNNYQDFFQIGVDNGDVVALYAHDNAIGEVLQETIGQTMEEVEGKFGSSLTYIEKENKKYQYDRKDEWGLYDAGDSYYTVFYDTHREHTVNALQIVEKSTEHRLAHFYGESSGKLAESFEIQFVALINAARVREGLEPLIVDKTVTRSARNHSTDMAVNGYFSHTNLEGESPFVRMEKEGLSFYMAGENIAMGQMSPIYAHEALMNSGGHRKNVLLANYEYVGVGVEFAENVPYYTQHFYK